MATEIALSRRSIVAAAGAQTSCSLGDEVVVLSLRAGVYYGLNSVGARIWDLVKQPRSVDEILVTLLEEYEVDAVSCEQDLLTLLRELAAQDLITVDNDTSS